MLCDEMEQLLFGCILNVVRENSQNWKILIFLHWDTPRSRSIRTWPTAVQLRLARRVCLYLISRLICVEDDARNAPLVLVPEQMAQWHHAKTS